MNKLYYCNECRRVITSSENCNYCNSSYIDELAVGAPVNVIGTKLKGKVLKVKDNTVRILIKDEGNNKMIREYDGQKLRKVL
jgi:preprotein translocase subunit YajC